MRKFSHKAWRNKNKHKINAKRKREYHKLIPKMKKIVIDYYNKKDISEYPYEIKKAFAQRVAQRIKITKKSYCKKCKRRTNRKLERHHPDYNFPLEIEILCTRHHRKLHYPDGKWGKNKKN